MNAWNIKTTSLRVERVIEATPNEVFDAWLDPNCKGSPWNGMAKAILQPVVDGLFYRMHLAESNEYELAHYGRFIALDRPHRIKHTWVSQHTRGLESVVTVVLEECDANTRLALLHENLPDDEMGRLHKKGWAHYLSELVAAMTARMALAGHRGIS